MDEPLGVRGLSEEDQQEIDKDTSSNHKANVAVSSLRDTAFFMEFLRDHN